MTTEIALSTLISQADLAVDVGQCAAEILEQVVIQGLRSQCLVTVVGIGAFASTSARLQHGRDTPVMRVGTGRYFRASATLDADRQGGRRWWRPIAAIRVRDPRDDVRQVGEIAFSKQALINAVMTRMAIGSEEAARALDSIIGVMRLALQEGQTVRWGRLGRVSLRDNEAVGFPIDSLSSKSSGDEIMHFQVTPPSAARPTPQLFEVVEVFFGTDRHRVPGASSPAKQFSGARGRALTYGVCEVSIPRNHAIGKLESPCMLRSVLQDKTKHIVLMSITAYGRTEFVSALATRQSRAEKRKALIFIHGFNTSFEDAARRAAQIAYDVQCSGVPFVYSWPSAATSTNYMTDISDADQAAGYLKAFILTILNEGSFDEVVLLAHSMGNRVLVGALGLMKQFGLDEDLRKMTEVVFAAPDIDADVFKDQIAPTLAALGIASTLYASSNDKAMMLSKNLNGGPRAGDAGASLLILQGIETVDASAVETGLFSLNHSYIGSASRLTADLHYLIEKRFRAHLRHGLEAIQANQQNVYWRFRP